MAARKWVHGLVAVALALSSQSAFGQEDAAPAAAGEQAEKQALAKRYLELTQIEQGMDATMKMVGPIAAAALIEELGLPTDGPEAKELSNILGEVNAQAMQSILPDFLEEVSKIAADTFTMAELEAVVAFYSSPAGRSFTAKSPAMAPQVGAAMQRLMPKLEQEYLRLLCARLGCDEEPVTPAGARPS